MITSHVRGSAEAEHPTERGSVLLISCLFMVILMIMASFIVDLGLLRANRRRIQNVADVAGLAAGYYLAGHANAAVTADPRGGCMAAFRSIRSGLRSIPAEAAIACTSLAASAEEPDCTDATPAKTVTATGTDPWVVSISYPVPDSVISDARLAGGVGLNDGRPCTRMKVQISQTQPTGFASVMGYKTLKTTVSSVVRGGINTTNGGVPALLLLDRIGCQVLTSSSNGSGNLGIIVRAVSGAEGGHAHSDSDGSSCGTTNTSYVIYGASNSNGGTSITVENGANGIQGTISTYATSRGSLRGASDYPRGISQSVSAGPVVSRQPFDRQYNPGTRPAIAQLHTAAWAAVTRTTAEAFVAGYIVVNCSADGTIAGAKIYVDCPNYSPAAVSFPNASDVAFNGQVTVGSGKTMSLPSANRVSIRGCSTCTGGNYYAISVAGALYVNIGSSSLASATCDDRLGPGQGGTVTNTTALTTFGSPIVISGKARICQTTVYQAENAATYTRRATSTGAPNCTGALPCPIATGAAPGGSYAISGVQTEWTAPNQQGTPADAFQPFEDLALWSESSDLSQVKSGGVLSTGGIFFQPNAPVQFRSPATGTPRNAQIVARTLQLLQGTLDMAPVARDAVRVPLPGGYTLIR